MNVLTNPLSRTRGCSSVVVDVTVAKVYIACILSIINLSVFANIVCACVCPFVGCAVLCIVQHVQWFIIYYYIDNSY